MQRAAVKQHSGKQKRPISESVQSRKGQVPSADHQGNQINRESRQNRLRVPKDHRHAMHGEDLVVRFRIEHAVVRIRQLETHHQRLQPADDQEQECGGEISLPEFLVVYGAEFTPERVRGLPQLR